MNDKTPQYIHIRNIGTEKGGNNYSFAIMPNLVSVMPLDKVEFLNAEEIGQMMGGS